MPPWRWNCVVCRQPLSSRPTTCQNCNSKCHIHCFEEETFWTRPSRTICRKCVKDSKEEQDKLQRLDYETFAATNALNHKLQQMRNEIAGSEEPKDIPALLYYLELLDKMSKALDDIRLRVWFGNHPSKTNLIGHLNSLFRQNVQIAHLNLLLYMPSAILSKAKNNITTVTCTIFRKN